MGKNERLPDTDPWAGMDMPCCICDTPVEDGAEFGRFEDNPAYDYEVVCDEECFDKKEALVKELKEED
jgi:hypothetical protein